MTSGSDFMSLELSLANDQNRVSYKPNTPPNGAKNIWAYDDKSATKVDNVKDEEATAQFGGGFGPSVTVWEQLKKTKRTHIIVGSVVSIVIGMILGAAITAIVFTQTMGEKKDASVFCAPPADGIKEKMQNVQGIMAATTPALERATVPCSPIIRATETTTTLPNQRTTPIPTITSRTPPLARPENCDVMYERKCFRAIVQEELVVHLNESKKMCESMGWKLANIYSRSHYFMIEGYLRSKFPLSGYISAWTGMTMDPKTQQIRHLEGKNVTLTGIHWHYGYPSTDETYTHMGIDVLQMPLKETLDSQGLWNYDPSWNGNTAVCEQL